MKRFRLHDFPMRFAASKYLRPLTVGDGPALFESIDNDRQHLSPRFSFIEEIQSVEDSINYLKQIEEMHADFDALYLGIFDDLQHQSILGGSIAFREIDYKRQSVLMRAWVTSDFEGRGIAITAGKKMIEYGKSIGIKHFEARTAVDNIRCQILMEQLHFKPIPGVIKPEMTNSKMINHYVYTLCFGRDANITATQRFALPLFGIFWALSFVTNV